MVIVKRTDDLDLITMSMFVYPVMCEHITEAKVLTHRFEVYPLCHVEVSHVTEIEGDMIVPYADI
jgi:hypothetical protein